MSEAEIRRAAFLELHGLISKANENFMAALREKDFETAETRLNAMRRLSKYASEYRSGR